LSAGLGGTSFEERIVAKGNKYQPSEKYEYWTDVRKFKPPVRESRPAKCDANNERADNARCNDIAGTVNRLSELLTLPKQYGRKHQSHLRKLPPVWNESPAPTQRRSCGYPEHELEARGNAHRVPPNVLANRRAAPMVTMVKSYAGPSG
jgi:hypothetical protein